MIIQRILLPIMGLWCCLQAQTTDTVPVSCFAAGYGAQSDSQIVAYSLVGQSLPGSAGNDSITITSSYLSLPQVRGLIINDPPVITSDSVVLAIEREAFRYTATAVDPDNTIEPRFEKTPSWLTASGAVLSGTPPPGTRDTAFMVFVSDGSFADTLSVRIKVVASNLPPEITSSLVADTAVEGAPFLYVAKAVDPNGTFPHISFLHLPSWIVSSGDTLRGKTPEAAKDTSFTVIATDGVFSHTITVAVRVRAINNPPVIVSPTTALATEHVRFTYVPVVVDPDNTPSVWFEGLPSWLSDTARTLTGNPPGGNGDTSFTIIASDGTSSDTQVVLLTVIAVNDPPQITSSSIVQVIKGTRLAYRATAVDPENDSIDISFVNLPDWLTEINDSLTGKAPVDPDTTAFTILAWDGKSFDTLRVTVFIQNQNTPPDITSSNTVTAVEDVPFKYVVSVNDPDNTPLFFSYPSGLPEWLKAKGPQRDTLSGTPTVPWSGAIGIQVIVTDGLASDAENVLIACTAVNDPPRISTRTPQLTAFTNQPYQYQLRARDEENDPFKFKPASGPRGFRIDSLSGLITWTPADTQVGTYTIAVFAVDTNKASDTLAYSIKVTTDGTPRCIIAQIPSPVRDSVRIPYRLFDYDRDVLSISFEYWSSQGWQKSTHIITDTGEIDSAHYIDTLIWLTSAELPASIPDSTQVRIRPTDTLPGFAGESNWFKVNNTPVLMVKTASPTGKATVHTGKAIAVEFSGVKADTASLIAANVTVRGSKSGEYTFTLTKTDSTLAIMLDSFPAAAESLTVSLSGAIRDRSGKTLDGNKNGRFEGPGADDYSWKFTTAKLGDYNANDSIDVRDLSYLANFWNLSAKKTDLNLIIENEIGPVSGTAPFLNLKPDSLFNYEDLFVFMQMWYWQAGGSVVAKVYGPLAKSISTDEFESAGRAQSTGSTSIVPESRTVNNSRHHIAVTEQPRDLRLDMSVQGINDLVACRYRIWCDQTDLPLESIANADLFMRNEGNAVVLKQTNPAGATIDMARLSANKGSISGDGRVASIILRKASTTPSPISLEYELIGSDHQTIESGVVSINSLLEQGNSKVLGITAVQVGPNPAKTAAYTGRFDVRNVYQPGLIDNNTPGVFFWPDITRPRSTELGSEKLDVTLRIYDIVGNLVTESDKRDILPNLLSTYVTSPYVIFWDGCDRSGMAVSPGVYQAALLWSSRTKSGVLTKKIGIER
jgi:hypothetical protein